MALFMFVAAAYLTLKLTEWIISVMNLIMKTGWYISGIVFNSKVSIINEFQSI